MNLFSTTVVALLLMSIPLWGSATTSKQLDSIHNSSGGNSLSVPNGSVTDTLATLNATQTFGSGSTWNGVAIGPIYGGTGLTSTPTDGQLAIGNSNTNSYSLSTLTAGSNVTITNGHGTITIASTSGGSSPTSPTDAQDYGFSTSVGSNALTINLKQSDGSTDCASSTCNFSFRNSTATTGSYTQVAVTSSLSLTIPSGATLGQTSGVNQYVWVYALNNAGTVALGVSGVTPTFDKSIVSTTAISSSATSGSVIYSSSALSNVASRIIGRIEVNETTAGTWASNATDLVAGVIPVFNATDWTSYTLTIGGTSSAPTPGSGATSSAKYRRVGDSMEIEYYFTQSNAGSAGSGTYLFPLPSSFTIDTNKATVTTTNVGNGGHQLGSGIIANTTSSASESVARTAVYGYNTSNLWMVAQTGGTGTQANPVNSTTTSNLGQTTIWYSFFAKVPISGWSAYGP